MPYTPVCPKWQRSMVTFIGNSASGWLPVKTQTKPRVLSSAVLSLSWQTGAVPFIANTKTLQQIIESRLTYHSTSQKVPSYGASLGSRPTDTTPESPVLRKSPSAITLSRTLPDKLTPFPPDTCSSRHPQDKTRQYKTGHQTGFPSPFACP